jgi:hypothetical protein
MRFFILMAQFEASYNQSIPSSPSVYNHSYLSKIYRVTAGFHCIHRDESVVHVPMTVITKSSHWSLRFLFCHGLVRAILEYYALTLELHLCYFSSPHEK